MNWELLRYSIFAIFPILTIYFAYKRKYVDLMGLYFFSFPFQNCSMYFLTAWNPYKIVSIGMLWTLFSRSNSINSRKDIKTLFASFIFVLLISSLCGLLNIGSEKAFMRLFMQNITYLLGFVPLFFVKYLPTDEGEKMFSIYKHALITTIIIGLVHYTFVSLGIPFAPIFRDVGTSNEIAQSQFGNSVVTRIYGFCGEPKNMAFYIAPFILAMFVKVFDGSRKKKYDLLILLCAAFILLNTYSSAAFIESALGMLVVLFLISNSGINLSLNKKIILILIVIFSIAFIVYFLDSESENFVKSFYERSFGRAETELEDGRMETLILDQFWKENIFTWILGYGAGLYSFHSEGLAFDRGFNPVQSGLVLNLVDFGFIGYFYFIYLLRFLYKIYNRIKIKLRNGENEPFYFFVAGIATLIGNTMYCMLGGNIITGMMPFIAIAYWYSLNHYCINENTDIYD